MRLTKLIGLLIMLLFSNILLAQECHAQWGNIAESNDIAITADKSITSLAQSNHVLVLFMSSYCDYCHKFAPIVTKIANDYGFRIYPLSFNGKNIDGLPEAREVTATVYQRYYQNKQPFAPVLFLENTQTKHFVTVAEGYISEAQLLQQLQHYANQGGLNHD